MKHKTLLITLAVCVGLGATVFAFARAQQAAPPAPAKPAMCPCMGEGMPHGMMGGPGSAGAGVGMMGQM